MRNMLSVVLALAVVSGLTFASCSKKVNVATYPEYTKAGNTGVKAVQKVKEEIDECEQMEIDCPTSEMRAYASAVDEDRDFARQQAVLFAKASLASQIESLVLNVQRAYRGTVKGNGKRSSEADIKQDVGSMAEHTLNNSRVICSNRYRLSDGTYECSVCISIPSGEVEKIAGVAMLNDDERMQIEFNAERFRDSYREELERYRAEQKNR